MKLSEKDIQYLEKKLAARPIGVEELYIEILDHILCKYEASEMEDVVNFWEKEKDNWTRWKIFKIKFNYENKLTFEYTACLIKSIFSLKLKSILIHSIFLAFAASIGYYFSTQEYIYIPLFLALFISPIFFFAWIYHTKDTFGESSASLKGKGLYSGKRDAFLVLSTAHFFGWGIFLVTIKHLKGFEGILDVIGASSFSITMTLFILLLFNRALLTVYLTKLKPFLFEIK